MKRIFHFNLILFLPLRVAVVVLVLSDAPSKYRTRVMDGLRGGNDDDDDDEG